MKKEFRIKKSEEFSEIIHRKHSLANACFVIYYADRKLDCARAGFSVSKKLGDAVTRNRIKRQVRMMVHELLDMNSYGADLIIIVRKGFLQQSYADNKKVLEKSLKTGKMSEYTHEVTHE